MKLKLRKENKKHILISEIVLILLVGCGQVNQSISSIQQEDMNQNSQQNHHQIDDDIDVFENLLNHQEKTSYFIDLPHKVQENAYYCVPAALQSVLEYHGVFKTQDELAILLNTSSVTGTEYEDLACVATQLIFPNGKGKYQFVIPKKTARQQFEKHLIDDLKNNDPVFVSIDNYIMYEDCPSAVHQIIVNGIIIENGQIKTVYFMDPSYTRQDSIYGSLKKTTMDDLWDAMIQNKEPGYVY